MTEFSITVPSNTIAAALLCLSEPKVDPRTLTHVLLKQRLQDVPEFSPFGISRKMAQMLIEAHHNMFSSHVINVTLLGGNRTRIRIVVPEGVVLEEVLEHDFHEIAEDARSGIRKALSKRSEPVCSGVQRAPFQSCYLALIGEIGDVLKQEFMCSVGVEMHGEKNAAVFSISEDAAILLMPVESHSFSTVFDDEIESILEETSND